MFFGLKLAAIVIVNLGKIFVEEYSSLLIFLKYCTMKPIGMHNYYVYIITNMMKTVLYIGVTNDLFRRLTEHLDDSKGEKRTFAGKYNCVHLIYYEHFEYISHAIEREKEIKKWSRAKKENLINEMNPGRKFLNEEIDPE